MTNQEYTQDKPTEFKNEDFMSVSQIARAAGVSVETIRRHV